MTASRLEPEGDAVSFLVVTDDGECGWGVEVVHVQAVLAADEAARDALDAARFGFPGAADHPARVIRLRSDARDGGVAIRGQLAIVSVPRDEIHALPPLLARAMPQCAFVSVVFANDHPPFLILDVNAVLGAAS